MFATKLLTLACGFVFMFGVMLSCFDASSRRNRIYAKVILGSVFGLGFGMVALCVVEVGGGE